MKGRIEDGEKPVDAAIRELCEESGICDAKADRDFGLWRSGFENQVWSFHLCSTPHALPESWVHHARDDGGLDLRFYWHSVNQPPNEEWPPLFQRALRHILNCVEGRR